VYVRLHHVLLAMPPGQEDQARAFYSGVLGMTEVEKPAAMTPRGGAWFRAGGVELHLGIDFDFRPALRAHPALIVDDLDDVVARLQAAGQAGTWDDQFPGHRRIYAADPFGNRLEFLQPA
jgi:catechol 2,3-dioxygenase-like lactoylglutathione lyase family enzyme